MHEPLADSSATAAQPPPRLQAALLQGLTAEQAHAVTYGAGPLLIIAGPGAGKTRTLIHRIAWLLACRRAEPWEILAVTFSVRAAGELRLRLADLLGEQVAAAVATATFHSVCARMLREDAAVFGRDEQYTIYDQADMRHVIEWLLSDSQRGAIQAALADYGQPASTEVLAEISLAKNRLLSPVGVRAVGPPPSRAADRRAVARGGGGAAALERVQLRRSAGRGGATAGRVPAPSGALPRALEMGGGR